MGSISRASAVSLPAKSRRAIHQPRAMPTAPATSVASRAICSVSQSGASTGSNETEA